MHSLVYLRMYAYVRVCMYAYMCMCMHTRKNILCKYTHAYIHMRRFACVYIFDDSIRGCAMYVYIHACLHTCIHQIYGDQAFQKLQLVLNSWACKQVRGL